MPLPLIIWLLLLALLGFLAAYLLWRYLEDLARESGCNAICESKYAAALTYCLNAHGGGSTEAITCTEEATAEYTRCLASCSGDWDWGMIPSLASYLEEHPPPPDP
jgi:hypothetical protein